MSSPTARWCEWFESLAPAVAGELAIALMHLSPGGVLRSSIMTQSPTDGFTQRIRRLAQNPMQDAGVAVMLASLTDFIFIERSSAERWEKNLRMLDFLDDAQKSYLSDDDALSEQLTEWIESTKLRHPLRARQWVKEYESWRELRAGPLDPEAINRAIYSMLPGE
jgi:hypothetical protein